jgi:predicted nucleic acid-binding protein
MISFDTNVLVYATASIADEKVTRARDVIARGMRAASSVLLLQTLAEFSNVAIRKACWREVPSYRRFARWFRVAERHVYQSIQPRK